MPAALTPGTRVGGRYRLEREIGAGRSASTWEGFDERLDRAVAVRVFSNSLDRRSLTRRAGQAASLTHPRVVRVFDTGFDQGHFFTVSELGQSSLASARTPLRPDEAVLLATNVADALAHAHERGVAHGHLSETNVVWSGGGAKVGDFALGAEGRTDARQDLVALGAMLRRSLGAQHGPVPDDPPGFGPIVEGLADGAYDSVNDLLDDLRPLHVAAAPHTYAPRRRGLVVIAVVILVALAAFGVTRLGSQSPRTQVDPGGRIEGTVLPASGLDDFDPFGDNKVENPGTVGNITDGDPQTFWRTERYQDGLGDKPGVGVVFDLGQEVEVGQAQLLLPAGGCSFEIRYGTDPEAPIDSWVIAASIDDSPPSAAIRFGGATARYWLLWITKLTENVPDARGAQACAISEATLYAP